MILILYLLLKVQSAPITTYTQNPLGCVTTGSVCGCATSCLDCTDNPYKCAQCSIGYFLFTLPSDHQQTGLKAGDKMCVQCPYGTYSGDTYTIYCGDCIENSQTWDSYRLCTYDYFVKNLDSAKGTYHLQTRTEKLLFYVIPVQLSSGGAASTQYFETAFCDGCEGFCKAASQTCFPVSTQYQYDLNNPYVSCADGYVFNEAIQGCDSCPSNCKSCNILITRSFDSQNRLTYTVVKKCLICNDGFALFQGYPKVTLASQINPAATTDSIWCEPCFSGCDICFYGNANLNLNSQSWTGYWNNQQQVWTDAIAFLYSQFNIAQRCTKCTSPPGEPNIPALDQKTCIRCSGQCSDCEYVSYLASVTGINKYPTRNKLIFEPAFTTAPFNPSAAALNAIFSQYNFRCRFCVDATYMMLALGDDCQTCSIANCQICAKVNDPNAAGVSPFSSFTNDFIPLSQESLTIENCIQCKTGYVLSSNSLTCTAISATNPLVAAQIAGCASYLYSSTLNQNICGLCNAGYSLLIQLDGTITCTQTCLADLNDFGCLSCVKRAQPGGLFVTRCQQCASGFFVNMDTGKCQACDSTNKCGVCVQYSYTSVYNSLYYNYLYDNDPITYGPVCQSCISATYAKNIYTGKCETCGALCAPGNYPDVPNGGCYTQSITTYCGVCVNTSYRSSSPDGTDCIMCPQYTQGCRARTTDELQKSNKFFITNQDATDDFALISYVCATTTGGGSPKNVYYDSILGRCLAEGDTPTAKNYKLAVRIDATAHCFVSNIINDIDHPSYFTNATQQVATITINKMETDENYLQWNKDGVSIFNIYLTYLPDATNSNNMCQFSKDTIFTTGIKQNVFAAKEINLFIDGQKKVEWYIQGQLIFDYFTTVSISGITIMPYNDYNYYLVQNGQNVNPNIQIQPFTIKFQNNEGAKFHLTDTTIQNKAAYMYYTGVDTTLPKYLNPYTDYAQKLKKYSPYNTYLFNVYEILVTNCKFYSLNYLTAPDLSFQSYPFFLAFDSKIPYLNIQFINVEFKDVAFDKMGVIKIIQSNMTSLPQWNSKIFVSQLVIQDAYFIGDSAFFTTDLTNTPTGMLTIQQSQIIKAEFNNSNGLIYFNTMQQIKIDSLTIDQCNINATSLIRVNTLILQNIQVTNSQFQNGANVIQSQYDCKVIIVGSYDYSGLRMSLSYLFFSQNKCYGVACFINIQSPVNDYEIPMNVTIYQLTVSQTQSDLFDESLVEAATSAAIQVNNVNQLHLSQYNSLSNANITIFYTEKANFITITNVKCSQPSTQSMRNNYCIFVNNFYQTVYLDMILLQNLHGIDNSFVAIASWNNLVYNTTIDGVAESINISNVVVDKCSIQTTVLAVPSGSFIIDSIQAQTITLSNLLFTNNIHTQSVKSTLRPSNPTITIQSPIGILNAFNVTCKNNRVSGTGANLYLSVGTQYLKNITMINSNYDPLHQNKTDTINYQPINNVTQGGHLYLQGYDINVYDSVFLNSTAQKGGAIFLKTSRQGYVYFNNTQITNAETPLDGSVVSQGGCMYIDGTESQTNFIMDNSFLSQCSVRADGGALYMEASDESAQFSVSNTIVENCFGLAGSAFSIQYSIRTQQLQQSKFTQLQVQANYTNTLQYFYDVYKLTAVEEFLFIKRFSAIQQDAGQMSITNCLAEGLYFQSYLSLQNPTMVTINGLESQHSLISYRPNIEIIEPLQNPINIDSLSFRNISAINSTVNCSNSLTDQETFVRCVILQIRVDYPDYKINPALMVVDMVIPDTYLKMTNLVIDRVICLECKGGLVQVLQIQQTILTELVYLGQSRCSNSKTAYFGCFAFTSLISNDATLEEDQNINYTYSSNLTYASIQKNTGLSRRITAIDLSDIIGNITTKQTTAATTAQTPEQIYNYAVPNPPWLAHIVLMGLNIQENVAVHGGGVYVYGLTANITQMYCSLQVVQGQGGCIYYQAPTKNGSFVFQRLNVYNSIFYKNNASIGGAIRTLESGISNITSNQLTFLQNHASLFGDNYAGYPTRMGVKIDTDVQTQSFLNKNTGWLHYPIVIKSGQIFNKFEDQDVVFLLLDDNNTVMNYQFNTISNMSSSLKNSISGEPTRNFDISAQGFNYSNLIIFFDPYQNITLDVTVTSKIVNIPVYYQYYPYQLIGFDTGYSLQARIRSVECAAGEAYSKIDGACLPCSNGTYVLEYKGLCRQINADTMNNTYLNQISLFYGHWRPDYLNDKAEYCKNQPVNCKGGYDSGNDLCQEGLIGALCEECDIYQVYWDTQYSMSAKYQCGLCSDSTTNIIMITVLSIWTVISTILSAKGNLEKMQMVMIYKIIQAFGWSSSQKASANIAVMMKIMNNHLQIISFLQTFQISVPQKAVDSVNTVSMPAKTIGNSLDCFLVSNTWGISLIYFRIIWSLIMQIIYLAAILLILAIAVLTGKLYFKVQYIYIVCIFMFLLLQPDYVQQFMLLISSRNISGVNWIQANVSYQYDTFTHDQWVVAFGIPGLLTWVLVLPLSFWYVIFQGAQQEKLDTLIYSTSWGFLYDEYRRSRYYWEFVKIFQRTLLVILMVYFQEDIIIKGIFGFLVVYLYYGLANHFNPYNTRFLNDLDAYSSVTLAISLVVGVFLFRTIEVSFLPLTIIGFVVIAVLNGIFAIMLVYFLFQGYLDQFAPKLDEVRDKITEKFPDLLKNHTLRPYLINKTKLNIKARKLWIFVAKVVQIGLQEWKDFDKQKPLQFYRVQDIDMENQEQIFGNDQLNLVVNHSQSLENSIHGNGSGNGHLHEQHEQIDDERQQFHQENLIPDEGKGNYQYK